MTHKEYQKLFLSAPLRYLYERGDISQRQYDVATSVAQGDTWTVIADRYYLYSSTPPSVRVKALAQKVANAVGRVSSRVSYFMYVGTLSALNFQVICPYRLGVTPPVPATIRMPSPYVNRDWVS